MIVQMMAKAVYQWTKQIRTITVASYCSPGNRNNGYWLESDSLAAPDFSMI